MLPVSPKVPVTLVTGFLGAGKTTLLRHLLSTANGRRFVVVENEFGDVGVDGSLLAPVCDLLFELTEGCVCCTVREDLVELFRSLAGRTDSFDHVLIETSGMATPGPVLQVFELPELRGIFELDGVVTVVDAVNVSQDLDEVKTCAEQVATADLLILNKSDRASPDSLQQLKQRLSAINPLARQVQAVQAQVPLQTLLQLRGADSPASGHSHSHSHGHSHSHSHGHGHSHGYSHGHNRRHSQREPEPEPQV